VLRQEQCPVVELGRITGIWRYPVKSMAAEALVRAEVSWHGIVHDRRWAFIRPGLERSNFPWLTIRENPGMRHYVPSGDTVRTPSGEDLDVTDPRLAAELGAGVRVIKQNRGVFDVAPLSLISTTTIAALGALVGRELEVQRFRPNLLVEPAGGEPWAEDGWVGRVLRIGGMRMRVDQRDKRCVMVNVDPAGTERDASVLRAIAQERGSCLGVYGTVVEPGEVSVGAGVVLEG
jgi:uncharacterized protein YcbX